MRDAPRSACLDANLQQADPREVKVQLWDQMCYRDQLHRSAKCGDGFGETAREIDESSYPRGFYRVMNFLARGEVAQGTLLMRAANVLFATLLFATALVISNGRLRKSFLLGLLITLGPLHLSLIPMAHAQSWLIPSLGTAWVFVLVGLDETQSRLHRQIALVGWTAGLVLSVGSRWEGGPLFVMISISAVAIAPSVMHWLNSFTVRILLGVMALAFFVLQVTDTVFSARRWVAGFPLSRAASGGPDVWEWISSWFMAFPGVLIEMYGTQGFANEMRSSLPLVPVIGALLLGGTLLSQFVSLNRRQTVVLAIWTLLTITCILYFTQSGLDIYDIDARYVTQFAHPFLGMILFAGSRMLPLIDDSRGRRFLIATTAVSAFWAQYYFLERYVRGVRPGFRWLSVGIDEWWWSGIEIGPNGMLLVGVGSFLLFANTVVNGNHEVAQSKVQADRHGGQSK
jgi:hypothetical protein